MALPSWSLRGFDTTFVSSLGVVANSRSCLERDIRKAVFASLWPRQVAGSADAGLSVVVENSCLGSKCRADRGGIRSACNRLQSGLNVLDAADETITIAHG